MCFKYCDSFPDPVHVIDDGTTATSARSPPLETERVMDACFQCKLCEVQCPYTPRDGHEFQLDFPKLVHRYDAIARKDGSPQASATGSSQTRSRASASARASFGVANVMNRVGMHRWFMEKLVGIDRESCCPSSPQTRSRAGPTAQA